MLPHHRHALLRPIAPAAVHTHDVGIAHFLQSIRRQGGAAIMTIIQIGCSQKGLANWIQQIVTGGIIVAASHQPLDLPGAAALDLSQ